MRNEIIKPSEITDALYGEIGEHLPHVVLDIGLPRLDGYEAARRIREQQRGKDPMLVALTGWGQEKDRHRSEEGGFDAHLIKPVDLAALTQLFGELSV